jgi:hypothetical protein
MAVSPMLRFEWLVGGGGGGSGGLICGKTV